MNEQLVHHVVNPPIDAFWAEVEAIRCAEGLGPFDMTQAVPSYPTFSRIRKHLVEVLENDSTSFYTGVPGLHRLREALVRKHPLTEHVSPGNVVITAGANHAMFSAFGLFFERGDQVALIEPYYFNYDMGLKMMGIRPVYYRDAEGDFSLNAERLIDWLSKNPVKGLVLITPNNPTGAVYAPDEIEAVLEYCAAHEIEVLLDETYWRFNPAHLRGTDLGRFLEGGTLSLVGSFSKAYSLTGYRVGYLATRTSIMEQALKIQDTSVICAPHIGQEAALVGLETCDEEVAEQVRAIDEKTDMVKEAFARCKHVSLRSCGAYFAYVEHPYRELSSWDAAKKLYQETGVVGLPGSIFGTEQERYIRLAYCNLDVPQLRKALSSLIALDQKTQPGT